MPKLSRMDSPIGGVNERAIAHGQVRPRSVTPPRPTPATGAPVVLDARVGASVADFIDTPRQAPSLPARRPVVTPFSHTVVRALEPVQARISDEVRRLSLVESVAFEYMETVDVTPRSGPSNEGDG